MTSSLRRSIQGVVRRGNVLYATVEDYYFGYATVRLSEGGARLSNLSTLGYPVAVDERVIVDYRAGVAPIVRPIFTSEYEEEEEVFSVAPKNVQLDDDLPDPYKLLDHQKPMLDHGIGWRLNAEAVYNPFNGDLPPGWWGQKAPGWTDEFIIFGQPDPWWEPPADGVWHLLHETTGKFPLTMFPGPDYLSVGIPGKYIIWCWIGWWDTWGQGISQTLNPFPMDNADFEIKIWKNGSVYARNSQRSCEMHHQSGGSAPDWMATNQLTTIVDLEPSDRIQMSIYQSMWVTFTDTGMGPNWTAENEVYGVSRDSGILLKMQLIPETQRS